METGAIIFTDTSKATFFKELKEVYLAANRELLGQKDNEDLLTQDEAAKLLKITKATLISYAKTGKVKTHQLGGRRVYYKRSEILQFSQTNKA